MAPICLLMAAFVVAGSQPPVPTTPPGAPIPVPAVPPGAAPPIGAGALPSGLVFITDAKVEKDELHWTGTECVPVVREVEVEVMENGKLVRRVERVTTIEEKLVGMKTSLNEVDASDANGKPLTRDLLAARLKEQKKVVIIPGDLTRAQRSIFKDETIFIVIPPPSCPEVVPVPLPAPVAQPTPVGR
jgi:hypothetical protein